MKEKLKILFGVLRGTGYEMIETRMAMDRYYIEDWNHKFSVGNQIEFEIPSFVEKILGELINYLYSDFRKYLDLEIDEWWYLYIDIYPKENRLVFQGSHKVEFLNDFEKRFNYDEMNKEVQDNIDYLYSEYSDTAHFDFEMYGRWGDGEVYKFKVDNRNIKITAELDEKLWQIGNSIMKEIDGTWWNDEAGADLDCRIWGDDILAKGYIKRQEYEDSGMYFEVTLDNIENFD